MSQKLEMKGVSPNQATFLLKCKCVKYSLVQKLIRKFIAYYMAHFFFCEVPDGKKCTYLNKYFYWHFNKLTAYVQFKHHFQLGICLKRPETFIHTATQTLIIKYTL